MLPEVGSYNVDRMSNMVEQDCDRLGLLQGSKDEAEPMKETWVFKEERKIQNERGSGLDSKSVDSKSVFPTSRPKLTADFEGTRIEGTGDG